MASAWNSKPGHAKKGDKLYQASSFFFRGRTRWDIDGTRRGARSLEEEIQSRQGEQPLEDQMPREFSEARRHVRINRSFAVSLHKAGVLVSYEGLTRDISQGGAFIRTKDWREFAKDEQFLLTFYLPPEFTGQDAGIRLLGAATVKRIDQENEGLGVQFNKELRQFPRKD